MTDLNTLSSSSLTPLDLLVLALYQAEKEEECGEGDRRGKNECFQWQNEQVNEIKHEKRDNIAEKRSQTESHNCKNEILDTSKDTVTVYIKGHLI